MTRKVQNCIIIFSLSFLSLQYLVISDMAGHQGGWGGGSYSKHHMEARWPSGRASDSGARGRGSILTQVAVLCP